MHLLHPAARLVELTCADVCWRMLTYADVCWRMLTRIWLKWATDASVAHCVKTCNCYYICVLILLYMCPHTADAPVVHCGKTCNCYYICVLILLYMCPHTTIYVSSYCYICVLILLYMCPHTADAPVAHCVKTCNCYYICVLILLYMCPYTTTYVSSYCGCTCCTLRQDLLQHFVYFALLAADVLDLLLTCFISCWHALLDLLLTCFTSCWHAETRQAGLVAPLSTGTQFTCFH
jgi:hypothetical protein